MVYSDQLEIIAPAKINLFLHVVGKRRDGYHLLESVFAFTETGDRVFVKPASQFEFSITGPFASKLSVDGDNLVKQAAQSLAGTANRSLDVAITLEKNLPIASGIGGGSADAAATLKLLADFWNLNWDTKRLETPALKLGADVPACLYDQPVLVRGIGDDIDSSITYKGPRYILLINPLISVSTPAVFSKFAETGTYAATAGEGTYRQITDTVLGQSSNSLEASAQMLCPEIKTVLACLHKMAGAKFVRMAGSGATCFAMFNDEASCHKALSIVQKQRPEWWSKADKIRV